MNIRIPIFAVVFGAVFLAAPFMADGFLKIGAVKSAFADQKPGGMSSSGPSVRNLGNDKLLVSPGNAFEPEQKKGGKKGKKKKGKMCSYMCASGEVVICRIRKLGSCKKKCNESDCTGNGPIIRLPE